MSGLFVAGGSANYHGDAPAAGAARMKLEDCQYRCEGCKRVACMDEEPSPGEAESTCADCYIETEVPC